MEIWVVGTGTSAAMWIRRGLNQGLWTLHFRRTHSMGILFLRDLSILGSSESLVLKTSKCRTSCSGVTK
jgi:hypothetical protein